MVGREGEANEDRRLSTLRRFGILDTPDEEVFDRITSLIAKLFDAPIALITLIDETRQWYKSRVGADATETARALAFCDYAIRSDEVMIVPDATLDPRFSDNAFVLGDPKIRFYAGAPLIAKDGMKIGTVCVVDRRPRTLDNTQVSILREMSSLVMAHFELRYEMLQTRLAKDELAAVIDTSPTGVIIARADGAITAWNDAATRIFGYTAAEMIGTRSSLWPAEMEDQAHAIGKRVIEGEIITRMRARGKHKSGRPLQVAFSARPVFTASGEPIAITYVVEDLSESVRTERIERRRYEILELAAHDAPIEQILQRLIEAVEFAIPEAIAIFCRLRGDRLFHAASGAKLPPAYVNAIEGMTIGPAAGSCGTAAYRGETVIVADIATDSLWEGRRAPALAHGLRSSWSVPIRNSHNVVLGTLAVYSKNTSEPTTADLRFLHEMAHVASIAMDAHDARVRLEEMALTDPLTDLPNRHGFERALASAIDSAQRRDKKVALGLLDLNRFKIVNDSLGHAAGDRLLREIAIRLQRAMRPGDVLARMGSDEFLFLLSDVESAESADRILRRVLSVLDTSFMPDEHEVFVRASVGVTLYPDDSREPSQLLRLADRAMFSAKSRGEGVAFYRGPQRRDGHARMELEASLNRALDNGEFELYYQPQLNLAAGTVFGAEALLRWNHPKLGLIMPDKFVKLAEETGLIVSIGEWVAREACRFGRRWLDAGGPGIVSVNVSPRQFEAFGLVDAIASALEDSRLPPDSLWLEITESLIMRSPESAAAMIADLRAMGVRSFIDDFGSGYSSLSHLRRFPVDGLKIDQLFLRDIGGPLHRGIEVALIRAILSVGRSMNLSIVAEGVETEAQRDFLVKHDCQVAQGYLFARPMPEREILLWSGSAPVAT